MWILTAIGVATIAVYIGARAWVTSIVAQAMAKM